MTQERPESGSPIVFFSMPFAKEVNVGEQSYNTDEVWVSLLKPAVPERWRAIRIDEVLESGPIPRQWKDYLRRADVAVFDVSLPNPNVYYELGMREAFVPNQHILIASEGVYLPFNIQVDRVLRYKLGEDVERQTFREHLRRYMQTIVDDLHSRQAVAPSSARLLAQLQRAKNDSALVAVWQSWKRYQSIPSDLLLDLADRFSNSNRIDKAVEVIRVAYQQASPGPDDPDRSDIPRKYAWYLRKNGQHQEAAELFDVAIKLNPEDVEAIGMLAGLHKREGIKLLRDNRLIEAEAKLELAESLYKNALTIDPGEIYNALNYAFMRLIRAGNNQEQWQGPYKKVIDLLSRRPRIEKAWDWVALGQSYLALGAIEDALNAYASATDARDWHNDILESEAEQIRYMKMAGVDPAACARALQEGLGIVEPTMASHAARRKGDIIIIHLSDLHFGTKPGGGTEVPMHRFRHQHAYSVTLLEHITNVYRQWQNKFPEADFVIVISGDIAYQATRSEYEEAQKFVLGLLATTGVPKSRLIIVPGNHDINWRLSGHDRRQRFNEYLRFIRIVYGKEDFSKRYPHVMWGEFGDDPPHPSQIFSVHDLQEMQLIITGFNSCILEDDTRHFGLVGKTQLEYAQQAVRQSGPDTIRIAVMHHHVLPIERRFSEGEEGAWLDQTIVRDFGLVEHKFHELAYDMVLHGHKHEPAVRDSTLVSAYQDGQERKSLVIIGAGSAAVDESELPQSRGNHIGVYRIHRAARRRGGPFLDVEWLELPFDDVESWKPSGRWTIQG